MILPRLRLDVQFSSHQEDDERFLVLHDPFGVADGPIMLHADMIEVLAACDGVTSTIDLAHSAGVDPNGPEILRVVAFIRQLEELGYVEGHIAEERQRTMLQEWSNLPLRPMVCADSTYPRDPVEFGVFCREQLGLQQQVGVPVNPLEGADVPPRVALVPHIDFRVAPGIYGEAFATLTNSPADLVVMIGTSHYWSEHPVVVGDKAFETPLGILPVLPHTLTIPDADIAHKPEHSLELHAVIVRYLWPDREVVVLPILVTSAILEEGALEYWTGRIREVVEKSGRTPIWLISGDLAHVGPKFGDPSPSVDILPAVEQSDRKLLTHLAEGDIGAYRNAIEPLDNAFRVCGHAPTILAFACANPVHGQLLTYQVWNEAETESSVTFASMVWQ